MIEKREVILFGKLADPLGSSVRVDGGDRSELVQDVRARVAALEPRLGELLADPGVRACVDGALAVDGMIAGPGCPIERIPVVSGG
ncbi:hypothetical protein RM533_07615 [Croceicoccus sp. F390]|uniref:Molybdopterin synthase sulfur carrier subunit n=1 Tax=Croceicoccus esteveae TaxID=3075597 RepID=A0ABU2ZHG8_9SPHN|nr:hypothetical protein [Croceicoccus sp. F390]MDT0576053.1 hypothetical protein [Croceicoccus sp. F390]